MRSRAKEAEALSAEVFASALRKVREQYGDYNASLFGGALMAPRLEWTDSESEWGAWVHGTRTLRLSERLLRGPWGSLLEVLKHEMAHQYVSEVRGLPEGEGPHGKAFREVCQARGIDSAASGEPRVGAPPKDEKTASILTRIEHLLSLAQSDNQHEAENAMATARRLMLKYNLTEVSAGASSSYTFRHIGKPTGRRMPWQRVLANILSDFFFVELIIVPVYRPLEQKKGTVFEICGSPENLEIASYAHDFLERSGLSLWKKHKREEVLGSDRDKQSFLYGVMSGFADKLQSESDKHQEAGLVWLGDPQLGEYFRARYPYMRRVSGRSQVKNEAFSAGHEAGGRIVLHRGVEAGEKKGAPRLLGSGGRQ